MKRWTRREVLAGLGRLPLLAGFAAVVSACGGGGSGTGYGSSGGGGGGGGGSCDGITPTMDIHTHPTCLTMADLNAGTGVTLTLMAGNLGHTHTVTLSTTDVQDLAGGSVTVAQNSTTYISHHHMVSFMS